MRTIYKYPLYVVDLQSIPTFEDRQVLHVGEQDGQLCLWAIVDPESPEAPLRIRILGTGHPADDVSEGWGYVNTVIMSDGMVWHVFVEIG